MTFFKGTFLGSAFTNATTHFARFEMDEEATEIRAAGLKNMVQHFYIV